MVEKFLREIAGRYHVSVPTVRNRMKMLDHYRRDSRKKFLGAGALG
jgi:hypothetical protein